MKANLLLSYGRYALALGLAATAAASLLTGSQMGWRARTTLATPQSLAWRSDSWLRFAASPQALSAAERLTWRELALGPYAADAWLRLAYIETLRGGALTPKADLWLQRSYIAAPLDPELLSWRQRFAFNYWDAASPTVRRAARFELQTFYADYENRARLDAVQHTIVSPDARLAFELTKRQALRLSEQGKPPYSL